MFEGLRDKRIKLGLAVFGEKAPRLTAVDERTGFFASYVSNMVQVLDQSALARALLSKAQEAGATVGLDVLLEPSSSFFYPGQNHIDLGYQPDLLHKTEKGLSRYLVSFTGALRRAWHHYEGCGPDLSLQPRGFLEEFRVAEADAEAVIHQVAWELRSQGAGFLWRHLLSGQNGDIAIIFEKAALENPENAFKGIALKAAFDQWFAEKERTAGAERLALETIDLFLLQSEQCRGFGRRALRRGDMQRIGYLPSGENYLAGCYFTGTWYRARECETNSAYLLHLEKDIKNIYKNQHHNT